MKASSVGLSKDHACRQYSSCIRVQAAWSTSLWALHPRCTHRHRGRTVHSIPDAYRERPRSAENNTRDQRGSRPGAPKRRPRQFRETEEDLEGMYDDEVATRQYLPRMFTGGRRLGGTKNEERDLAAAEMEEQVSPRFRDSDVRLYLARRQLNQHRPERRGGLPPNDALPRPNTFLKLVPAFQQKILQERSDALARRLPLQPEHAYKLYKAAPGLLCQPTMDVAQCIKGVRVALRCDTVAAADKIIAQPLLAYIPTQLLQSRAAAIAAATQLPLPMVLSMLEREPRPLLQKAPAVISRLSELSTVLGVDSKAALLMVCEVPELVGEEQRSVHVCLDMLRKIFGHDVEVVSLAKEYPWLLTHSRESLEQALQHIARALSVPMYRSPTSQATSLSPKHQNPPRTSQPFRKPTAGKRKADWAIDATIRTDACTLALSWPPLLHLQKDQLRASFEALVALVSSSVLKAMVSSTAQSTALGVTPLADTTVSMPQSQTVLATSVSPASTPSTASPVVGTKASTHLGSYFATGMPSALGLPTTSDISITNGIGSASEARSITPAVPMFLSTVSKTYTTSEAATTSSSTRAAVRNKRITEAEARGVALHRVLEHPRLLQLPPSEIEPRVKQLHLTLTNFLGKDGDRNAVPPRSQSSSPNELTGGLTAMSTRQSTAIVPTSGMSASTLLTSRTAATGSTASAAGASSGLSSAANTTPVGKTAAATAVMALASLLAHHPEALLVDVGEAELALSQLQQLFACTPATLLSALTLRPSLLLLPERVPDRLAWLSCLLLLPLEDLTAMFLCEGTTPFPQMKGVAFHLAPLLTSSRGTLTTHMRQLSLALPSILPTIILAVCRSSPQLLFNPTSLAVAEQAAAVLSNVLAAVPEEMTAVLVPCPHVLLLPLLQPPTSHTLSGAVLSIAERLGIRRSQALMAMISDQAIVELARSESVLARLALIGAVARANAAWAEELRRLLDSEVGAAAILIRSHARAIALAFLMQSGRANDVSVRVVLSMPPRKLATIFPSYPSWLLKQVEMLRQHASPPGTAGSHVHDHFVHAAPERPTHSGILDDVNHFSRMYTAEEVLEEYKEAMGWDEATAMVPIAPLSTTDSFHAGAQITELEHSHSADVSETDLAQTGVVMPASKHASSQQIQSKRQDRRGYLNNA